MVSELKPVTLVATLMYCAFERERDGQENNWFRLISVAASDAITAGFNTPLPMKLRIRSGARQAELISGLK